MVTYCDSFGLSKKKEWKMSLFRARLKGDVPPPAPIQSVYMYKPIRLVPTHHHHRLLGLFFQNVFPFILNYQHGTDWWYQWNVYQLQFTIISAGNLILKLHIYSITWWYGLLSCGKRNISLKTSVTIGAWKCNFLGNYGRPTTTTDQHRTDQPTNQPTDGQERS